MRRAYTIDFTSTMSSQSLRMLRERLTLQPRGRLTDSEDVEFGYRYLATVPDRVVVRLYRMPADAWRLVLLYERDRPSDQAVHAWLAETLDALDSAGVSATRHSGEPARTDLANDDWLHR